MFASQLLSSRLSLAKQCVTHDLKTFAIAQAALAKVPKKLWGGDTPMVHQTYRTLTGI